MPPLDSSPNRSGGGDGFVKQQAHILRKPPGRRTMEDIYLLQKSFSSIPFFKDLDSLVRTQVCKALMLEEFGANQTVFREGEPGDKLYIIIQGSVGIFIKEVGAQDVEEESLESRSPRSPDTARASKLKFDSPEDDHETHERKKKKSILKSSPVFIPEDDEVDVADTASDPGDSKTDGSQSPRSQNATDFRAQRRSRLNRSSTKDPSRFASAPPVSLSSEEPSLQGDATRMSLKRVCLNRADVQRKRESVGVPSHSAKRARVPRHRGSILDDYGNEQGPRHSITGSRRTSAAHRTSVVCRFDSNGGCESPTTPRRTSAVQFGKASTCGSALDGRRVSASSSSRRASRRGSSAAPALLGDLNGSQTIEDEEEEEHEKQPPPAATSRKATLIRRSITVGAVVTSTAATEAKLRQSLARRGSIEDQVTEWLETVRQDTTAKSKKDQKKLPSISIHHTAEEGSGAPPRLSIVAPSALKGGRRSVVIGTSGIPGLQALPEKPSSSSNMKRPSVSVLARRTSYMAPEIDVFRGMKPSAGGLQTPVTAATASRRESSPAFMNAHKLQDTKLLRRQSTHQLKYQRRQSHAHGQITPNPESRNDSGSEHSCSSEDLDEEPSALEMKIRAARSEPSRLGGRRGSGSDSQSDASSGDSADSLSPSQTWPTRQVRRRSTFTNSKGESPKRKWQSQQRGNGSTSPRKGKALAPPARTSRGNSVVAGFHLSPMLEDDDSSNDGLDSKSGTSSSSSKGRASNRSNSSDSSTSSSGSSSSSGGSSSSSNSSSNKSGDRYLGSGKNAERGPFGMSGSISSNSSGEELDEEEAKRRTALMNQALTGSRRVSLWTDSDDMPPSSRKQSLAASYQTVSHARKEEDGRKSKKLDVKLANIRRLSGCEKLMPKLMQVAILKAGATFGEVALQTDQPRSATVKTLQDSYFATLTRDEYKLILQSIFQKQTREREGFLADLPLLAGVGKAAIIKMAALLQQRVLNKHDFVYDIDMPVLQVYFAKAGEFAVRCRSSQSDTIHDEPREVERTRSSFSMQAKPKKGTDGWLHRNKDDFFTVALLKPPCVLGLTDYMQGERRYNTKVVVMSLTGTVYCLLAKELVYHFSREARDQLQLSATAESMFYNKRSHVLRQLHSPLGQKPEMRGQRRWRQELSTSARLQFFRGELCPNDAWKYYLEKRLAAMSRAFKHGVPDEDAQSIAPSKIPDDMKEQVPAKQTNIKACWWIEELITSNHHALDDLCLLADRNIAKKSRRTRSLSPRRIASPEPLDRRIVSPGRRRSPNPRHAENVSPNRSKTLPEFVDSRSASPGKKTLPNPSDTENALPNQSKSLPELADSRSVSSCSKPVPGPRDTTNVSPDQSCKVHHDAELETGLSKERSLPAQEAPADARLALAFNRKVFHSPSPDAAGISSVTRRLPVAPKGKWYPAELAFEEVVFRPKDAIYGSAAWLRKRNQNSESGSASKQCSVSNARDAEHPPRCMTAPPTNGEWQTQDKKELLLWTGVTADGQRDATPSTAAPSSPLRDCTPLRHTSPLRGSRSPPTPDCAPISRGRRLHDQEHLPARAHTSQGGAIGDSRHFNDGKDMGLRPEDLPARPQTSLHNHVFHTPRYIRQDTALMAQPMVQKQPLGDVQAKADLVAVLQAAYEPMKEKASDSEALKLWDKTGKACRESASPVKALTNFGFFAEHLVQSAMWHSPDVELDGKEGSPIRDSVSAKQNPGGSAAHRARPVHDLQHVYNQPRECASAARVEASPVYDLQHSRTPRPMRFCR